MQSLNYKNFCVGLLVTLLCALALFITSYVYGKNNLFLLLNGDLGIFADYFFRFGSFLGEAIAWVIVFAYIIFSGRNFFLPLLISGLVFTTLFTQVCKYLIVPDALRPASAIKDHIFHTVKNVIVYTSASFPSGHTATAFTIYLLLCLVLKNNWWLLFGFIYALLVGYSRIYLAEHFPFDVAGGIIAAIFSVLISILVQNKFSKRKTSIS